MTLAYDLVLVACNSMGYCGDNTDQYLRLTITPSKLKLFEWFLLYLHFVRWSIKDIAYGLPVGYVTFQFWSIMYFLKSFFCGRAPENLHLSENFPQTFNPRSAVKVSPNGPLQRNQTLYKILTPWLPPSSEWTCIHMNLLLARLNCYELSCALLRNNCTFLCFEKHFHLFRKRYPLFRNRFSFCFEINFLLSFEIDFLFVSK